MSWDLNKGSIPYIIIIINCDYNTVCQYSPSVQLRHPSRYS